MLLFFSILKTLPNQFCFPLTLNRKFVSFQADILAFIM